MFAIENLTIYDSKAMWTEDRGIESEEEIRLGSWKCTKHYLLDTTHTQRQSGFGKGCILPKHDS